MAITRFTSSTEPISITASATTSPVIRVGEFAGGIAHVISGSVTSLQYWVCHTADGTYIRLYDSTNTAIARTVATSRAYALPDEVFGAEYLRIVGDATGVIRLSLKT